MQSCCICGVDFRKSSTITGVCGAAGGCQPAAWNPPCMYYELYWVCHPTILSISFNCDHSETSPERRKPNQKRKPTGMHESYSIIASCCVYVCVFY